MRMVGMIFSAHVAVRPDVAVNIGQPVLGEPHHRAVCSHSLVSPNDRDMSWILLIWITVLLEFARIRHTKKYVRSWLSTYYPVMRDKIVLLVKREVLFPEEYNTSLYCRQC